MNDGWAKPFGDFNHRWTHALFGAMPPIRDLLNGRWLGHPLHGAATDIPIGLLLGSVVLDVLGQPTAADITLVATLLFMLAAARHRPRRLLDDGRRRAHPRDPPRRR